MIRVLLFALLAYFLYRFIFNFLIPVVRASREMKNKMNEFQNRMQQQQGFAPKPEPVKESGTPKEGDYIDFEEMK